MPQLVIKEDDIDALPDIIDVKHPHAMRLEIINEQGNHVFNVIQYNRKTCEAIVVGPAPFTNMSEYREAIKKVDGELPYTTVTLTNSTIRYKTK